MSHRSTTSDKRVRRFLPEPIETSSRSSRVHQVKLSSRELNPLKQRCLRAPKTKSNLSQQSNDFEAVRRNQPSENGTTQTSFQRSRDRHLQARLGESHLQEQRSSVLSHPRKFQPQLVETEKRSFRRQQTQHTLSFEESIPGVPRVSNNINIVRDPPADDASDVSRESPFSYMSLQQRQETRRHSFRVPDLPAIPSSCSEASDASGCSVAHGSHPTLLLQRAPKSENNPQSHHGNEYSEYVLALATRSAEKQLEEQALAAFPNEQVYQPVDHFAIDKEDEDSVNEDELQVRTRLFPSGKHRRASSADLPWELEYLRRHKEEAEMCDRAMAGTKRLHFPSIDRRSFDGATQSCGNWTTGFGLPQTKQGPSPPMLGDDLVFPQSFSPETTICESNSTEHKYPQDKSYHPPGLWYANSHLFDNCDGGGLWMGTCRSSKFPDSEDSRSVCMRVSGDAGEPTPKCSTGTLTEHEKPPPVYSREVQASMHTNQHISKDEDLDRELNDSVVTQIYNYLSLGYPCVARYYDYELSIVSGIPVADLRRDDLKTDAKGYVSIMSGNSMDKRVAKGGCMRWIALRLYIQEWARKRPRMTEGDGDHGTWGVCERKGSWAI
ncbi:hypothetical protein BO94DRAFT_570399 [Aspergillus sclerotioniger CBS 115572]|uniref:Uncharacterized protein n=1 Tax=Aspergillus sclerotioniger CBS 115572 TaxID=1450535 RepID=A0A317UV28_9EURO|nr:hypothetical protein BO94DRAFT_570399 [Aspergillus sclerotioniger CBS 115572]PWY65276.1 hypothetical protein BO94DRAFT_570399 [Aspergillus sclerotioniger CBS 115572]